MRHILRNGFSLVETFFFGQTSETGQILLKTVLLHKISQRANLSFRVF